MDWYRDVAANLQAVLAEDGSYFLNIKEHAEDGQRNLYVKKLAIAHVEQWGWRFVDEFCWRKTDNGVPGGWGNRFKNAWEPVFHFCRQPQIKFRPQAVGHVSEDCFDYSPNNPKSASGSGLLGTGARGAAAGRPGAGDEDGRFTGIARPSNVIEAKAESSQGSHSAPFPRKPGRVFRQGIHGCRRRGFRSVHGKRNHDGGIRGVESNRVRVRNQFHVFFRDTRYTVAHTDCVAETQLVNDVQGGGETWFEVESVAGLRTGDWVYIERTGTNEEMVFVLEVDSLQNRLRGYVSITHPAVVKGSSRISRDTRVPFEPFIGVGPRRFFDLFSIMLSAGYPIERKTKAGKVLEWRPRRDSKPRIPMAPSSYLQREKFSHQGRYTQSLS